MHFDGISCNPVVLFNWGFPRIQIFFSAEFKKLSKNLHALHADIQAVPRSASGTSKLGIFKLMFFVIQNTLRKTKKKHLGEICVLCDVFLCPSKQWNWCIWQRNNSSFFSENLLIPSWKCEVLVRRSIQNMATENDNFFEYWNFEF